MALQPRLVRIDDLTQLELQEDGTTVVIVVDDGSGAVKYELDFSEASVKAFRDALEPFLRNAAGHRIPPKLQREIVALPASTSQIRPKSGSRDKETMRERRNIREWHIQHWEEYGLPKPGSSGRGRIHAEVIEAYYGRRNGTAGPGGDEGISGKTGNQHTGEH